MTSGKRGRRSPTLRADLPAAPGSGNNGVKDENANSNLSPDMQRLPLEFGGSPPPIKRRRRGKIARRQPPRYLRRVVENHLNMGSRKANLDKHTYLGALRYLPHAIFKLLENIPQPWESDKEVNVLYHVTGAITFVKELPMVEKAEYIARWGEMWDLMRREKHDRQMFRRMRLPPFDDEEPPTRWSEVLEGINTPPPIIDDENPEKQLNFKSIDGRCELLSLAYPFIQKEDLNSDYCFDNASFFNAKSLGLQISGGPKFQSILEDEDRDVDYTDFNDARRVIVRHPISSEMRVAYPSLYNTCPRDISIGPYQGQPLNAVPQNPREIVGAGVNKSYRCEEPLPADAPSNLKPFLADESPPVIKKARKLLSAPYPFNVESPSKSRAQDISLLKSWIRQRPRRSLRQKTRISLQRLLKLEVKRRLAQSKRVASPSTPRKSLLSRLASTKFFRETRIDWLEAGLQLVQQGHHILQLMIHRRGLHFLHLDYNFNLKPTKTLTTKERKRSRFGHSFHLVRELLKATKIIVDAHVQFRLGNADAYELADALQYIFNHMGQLTGIYRYKYRVMHQIRECKDLKHLIYDRFNADGLDKGPGCGIWQPSWRVWLEFLRGMLPLLERWLGNLLVRQFEGRVSKGMTKTVTKQRLDSHYDLELRAAVLRDILEAIPDGIRQSKTKLILQHLGEAWRCWKAGIPWEVPGMPEPLTLIIERYVRAKSTNYVRQTYLNRERLRSGRTADRSIATKSLGRLTRLWLKEEQTRQRDYVQKGPDIEPEDAVICYRTMAQWLEQRQFEAIPFPPVSNKNDNKILILALENLRDSYSSASRLNQTQREELALIEQAIDDPHEFLTRIKRSFLIQRVFREVGVELIDFHTHATPVYHVDPIEKIADAYLDQYLWFEADRRQLFPAWVKPADDEVAPLLVRKWCQGITSLEDQVWGVENDETSVHVNLKLEKFLKCADFTLLNRLLRLALDPHLADYITAKMNVTIAYKDMSFTNQVGILRGLQFSSFVIQYYGLMFDLMLLGLPRAHQLFSGFPKDKHVQKMHPIMGYMRYIDKVYMVWHFSREEADNLILASDLNEPLSSRYPMPRCWSRDFRMHLVRRDVDLSRAVFGLLSHRIPRSLAEIKWDSSRISVYSIDNPAFVFELLSFEVRLTPRFREDSEGADAVWSLTNRRGERYARAYLRVSESAVSSFAARIRQIVMSSGATTFAKIVRRWNTALTSLFTYFREAAISTPELLDVLVRCETRIQNKVKLGLNSKMPARFPPCVFYSPEELGGLSMLSASHILIPSSDVRWSKQLENGTISHFRSGITHAEGSLIPNVFRYVPSWEAEFLDSQRVWAEYASKREESLQYGRRISLEDLEDSWDRGVPRINTLFQKDRHTLTVDKGYRVRQCFRVFNHPKYNPFWWTNSRHDGRLWNLATYRQDVVQALGGIEAILEHTLFRGTGFDSWEGLFWETGGGLEDQLKMRKLTNAQRTGLSQIPNRRFTLWWSPTINRANVYVGFQVQLDLTGIFLHGKIPTLKISLVQIFRAHLWQKIHESVVMDLCQVFDRELDSLYIDRVEKPPIHPRKSYRMTSSTADIVLTSTYRWRVSKPSFLRGASAADDSDFAESTVFWIDVQLRYGDYDSHDVTRYTRAKFLDYTHDGVSKYPSATGVMVCIDLAYNVYDAYGNWFPGLKPLLQQALAKIMRANPALFVLRERIRKGLQLYQAQPVHAQLNSGNYVDLFGRDSQLFVDDSMVYRTAPHKTLNGNWTAKPVSGAVFVLDPHTGQLFFKVLHQSVWAGQTRRNALAKWRSAEEVGALLQSMPREDLPKQLILTSRGLLDPLEVHMLDFPNISVRLSELSLPFKAVLQLPVFSELLRKATESRLILFNLYDNWLANTEPFTCFSRLLLLLRGLQTHPEKAKVIIWPYRSVKTEPTHIWPSYTADDWIRVENELSDLIIGDYGRKHNINVQALTQSEIRDIILGQPIKTPSQERQELIENDQRDQVNAVTTTTHNVHGEEMAVVTTSNYEQQHFASKTTWRNCAIASTALPLRAPHLTVSPENRPLREDTATYVFPSNILREFVEIADVRTQIAGLIYGKSPLDRPSVKEVQAIAILPQLGTITSVQLGPDPEDVDPGLELLGLVHTTTQEPFQIAAADLSLFAARGWGAEKCVVSLSLAGGALTSTCFRPTLQGIEWGATNKDLGSHEPPGYSRDFADPGQLITTESIKGYFYTPQDDVWNFVFLGSLWNPRARCYMKVGFPLNFYHDLHRPVHFLAFSGLETNEEDEYENEFD